MIPLKVHNVIDYVVGVVLLVCPYLFGFSGVAAAKDLFLFAGATLIVYSLLTNYYYAVARVIPLGVHMVLDCLVGVLAILGPSIFGYRDMITGGQYAIHWIMGVAALGLVALTSTRTEAAKTPEERREIAHELTTGTPTQTFTH